MGLKTKPSNLRRRHTHNAAQSFRIDSQVLLAKFMILQVALALYLYKQRKTFDREDVGRDNIAKISPKDKRSPTGTGSRIAVAPF